MTRATPEPALSFSSDGPFFPMVTAFFLSTIGLGPLYQADNPLRLSAKDAASYHGLIEPQLDIDLGQIRDMTQHLPLGRAIVELCGMLIVSAHAIALDRAQGNRAILESPTFEFFRQVRNAAAHGNRFTFSTGEPRRLAQWRTVTLDRRTHAGMQCFGHLLNAADALALLRDIESMLTPRPRTRLSPSGTASRTS
jgi:hypothetical protein